MTPRSITSKWPRAAAPPILPCTTKSSTMRSKSLSFACFAVVDNVAETSNLSDGTDRFQPHYSALTTHINFGAIV